MNFTPLAARAATGLRRGALAAVLAALAYGPLPSPPALAAGVVTTCTEAGLNAALAGGGNLTFNCGGPTTITITRTKSISTSTSIDGGGQVTFSGGGSGGSQFRMFDVQPGATFSVSNLTMRDAFDPTEGGGAIRNAGTLNVTNVSFLNNVADGGAAILIYGSGSALTVTNSTFSGNSADTPMTGGNGGAIDVHDGQVSISGSTFTGNHAQSSGSGGAINTFKLGHLNVANSTFTNNVAHFSGGALAAGNVLALTNSTFTANSVSAGDGGALWSAGSGSTVDGATLRSNTASDNGGGIVTAGGSLAVSNTTLDSNTAGQFGGGIENMFTSLTVSNARITNNHAGGDGGGINTSNDLAVDHTTISGNVAANGGAVAQKAFGLRATITASTLSGNRAGANGGALHTVAGSIFTYDTTIVGNTAQRGGAANMEANYAFSNTTIANNTASFTTGGVYNGANYLAVFFNTIVANNTANGQPQNCNSPEPTLGYNLDSDGTCGLQDKTDVNRVDPKLGPLQDNGGPTQTMLPAAGSPAIDAGGPTTPEPTFGFACLATDQRGQPRPQGHACDIGAVETPYVAAPPSQGSSPVTLLAQPQRIADTRAMGGPIAAGSARCFPVAGLLGIPADAAAVALNVTAVGQSTNGWLTVYPNGQAVPATSTLNFGTSEYAMANGTLSAIGSGGQVCVSVGTVGGLPGSAHVILDATGYLPSAALQQVAMLPAPVRLADTRTSGGAITTGNVRCFAVAGQQGIPSDAAAVVLNVTAVGYPTKGWLTAYPSGQPVPPTSTLNFDQSEYAMANNTLMRIGGDGQVCVSVGTINNAPGSAQVILDATGYLTSSALNKLPMLASPQRLVDTRSTGGAIASGSTRCFTVAGQAGIPANATGVVVNVTAVGYGANGWVTAYPSGQAVPATSTLNFDVSEYAMANGTMVALGSGGQVCTSVGTVNSAPGSTNVILDVVGYLTP